MYVYIYETYTFDFTDKIFKRLQWNLLRFTNVFVRDEYTLSMGAPPPPLRDICTSFQQRWSGIMEDHYRIGRFWWPRASQNYAPENHTVTSSCVLMLQRNQNAHATIITPFSIHFHGQIDYCHPSRFLRTNTPFRLFLFHFHFIFL